MRKDYRPHLLMLDQDQQLIAANAMMRQMALQANPLDKLEGYRQVANYLELGQFMTDSKLLDTGIKALENKANQCFLQLSTHGLKKKNTVGELSHGH